MNDHFRLEVCKAGLDQLGICHAALSQFQAGNRRNHFALAGSEVIKDENMVPLWQPVLDEVGT